MGLIKRLLLEFEHSLLLPKKIISEKWYCIATNKYLKHLGVVLNGKPKFIARDVKFDLTDPSKISIGAGSVITSKVTILIHDYSIECGLVTIGKEDPVYESLFIKPVQIGDNCFIGQNSFIKPGTTIGDNCIIGAGSVVNGNIPANSIVIGNPCRIVKTTNDWAEKKYLEHKYQQGSKRR